MKKNIKRSSVLALAVLAIFSWIVYLFYPNFSGEILRADGVVEEYQSCRSKSGCKHSVKIGQLRFDCHSSPFGATNRCPKFYIVGQSASATYYLQPSLLTYLTGVSHTPVLITFRQNNQIVYQVSRSEIQGEYIWPGSGLLCAIFAVLFFAINQHSYFRKEA